MTTAHFAEYKDMSEATDVWCKIDVAQVFQKTKLPTKSGTRHFLLRRSDLGILWRYPSRPFPNSRAEELLTPTSHIQQEDLHFVTIDDDSQERWIKYADSAVFWRLVVADGVA
jgi:hypothetical protein